MKTKAANSTFENRVNSSALLRQWLANNPGHCSIFGWKRGVGHFVSICRNNGIAVLWGCSEIQEEALSKLESAIATAQPLK